MRTLAKRVGALERSSGMGLVVLAEAFCGETLDEALRRLGREREPGVVYVLVDPEV